MASPAQKHFQRVSAAQKAAANEGANIRPNANQYELMMGQLYEHTRQLKNVESIKLKGELKATLLADYAPYIDGVIAGDSGLEDQVLMTLLVWRIDAADYDGALDIAAYAIKHTLDLPDRYKRSTICVIVEEIADAAHRGDVDLAILEKTLMIATDQDMPDQVRAKMYKALGLNTELQSNEPATALNHLQTALSYHDKCGVKKDIERLQRLMKNSEGAVALLNGLKELAAETPATGESQA